MHAQEDRPLGSRYTLLRPGLTPYQDAWQLQQRVAERVRRGSDPVLILLEHPPTYTLGSRGKTTNLLRSESRLRALGADVVQSDRGGDVTFHGPGQVVGYPILDLRAMGLGPVAYVRGLEATLIEALPSYGIVAGRIPGRPGVWVGNAKIAAIGVRISGGVSTHGFALNVNTDLSYFAHIVPCGLSDASVTSMHQLTGERFDIEGVMDVIVDAFQAQFRLERLDSAPAREEIAVGR